MTMTKVCIMVFVFPFFPPLFMRDPCVHVCVCVRVHTHHAVKMCRKNLSFEDRLHSPQWFIVKLSLNKPRLCTPHRFDLK